MTRMSEDEHRQKRIFDQPGGRTLSEPGWRHWDQPDGPAIEPPAPDKYTVAAHRILEEMEPIARQMMAQAGRHYSDLLAEKARQRHLDLESARDMAAAWGAPGGPAERARAVARIDRARKLAAQQPTSGWQGLNHMSADQRQAWRQESWPALYPDSPETPDVDRQVQR